MPEGSVDLDSDVMCWKGKVHIFVVLGVHIVSGLAVAGTAIGEFMVASSANHAEVQGSTDINGKAKAVTGDVFGGIILFFLIMPALMCLIEGISTSLLLCCKSKCCYGYCAIMSVLFAGSYAYGGITALTADKPVYMFSSLTGMPYKISFKLSGAFGIIAVINSLYCTVILCKMSYFDRSGGGQEGDLYDVDVDVESDSKSSETLKELTGVY